jgi:glycosyltransferase involved in cell wall biosynthesis
MPTIGVYILSYNRPEYLEEALISVINQTHVPDRIVILDNGSIPEVKLAVNKYLSDKVIWVGSDKNNGSCWNHNRALNLAQEEYFNLMHDDDRMCPDFLENLYNHLTANEMMIAVGSNGHIIDELGKNTGKLANYFNCDKFISSFNLEKTLDLYPDYCLPYTMFLYKTDYIKNIIFFESKIADVIFMITVAEKGLLMFLNIDLYERREHPGQDSNTMKNDDFEILTDFVVSKCENCSNTKDIMKRVKLRELAGWLERIKLAYLEHKSIRKITNIIFEEKPAYFNPFLMGKLVLTPRYFGKTWEQIVNKLK